MSSPRNIWQADFYYHPNQAGESEKKWELIICDCDYPSQGTLTHQTDQTYIFQCSSQQANSQWVTEQIRMLTTSLKKSPDKIQVFRPQSLGLLTIAGANLGIEVEATRNTYFLKEILTQRHQDKLPQYNPLALDKSPPQALPESIWGDEWQIANIAAGQIVDLFGDRPIPIRSLPESLMPINLALASNIPIPGLVVYGGKKSMQLARWIDSQIPAYVNYIPTEVGKSGGFILETGLVDRWVFNTFESAQAASIAEAYEQKKQASKGLHFLLIQPDDSGMTTTAFWLLREN